MNFLIEKCTQKEALQIFCSASYNLSVFFYSSNTDSSVHMVHIFFFYFFSLLSFLNRAKNPFFLGSGGMPPLTLFTSVM